MFMLVWNPTSGLVSKAVKLPVNAKSLRGKQLRSRPIWMEKMNVEAKGWGASFYAFRYRGEWHLCDVHAHHTPVRSLVGTDEGRVGAEVWLEYKERRARRG